VIIPKMKARHRAASGGGQSASDPVPADENDGKSTKHMLAHGLEQGSMLSHELR
jgi:hypothetical protein